MKLYPAHTSISLRRFLEGMGWFTPLICVAVLTLEYIGRRAVNDVQDLTGVGSLLGIISVIALKHRQAPLGWVKFIGGLTWKLARFADRFKYEVGFDLRLDPPIRPRMPGIAFFALTILAIGVALSATLAAAFPDGWRGAVVQVSYVGYLAGLILLWGVLLTFGMTAIFFPAHLIEFVVPQRPDTDPLTQQRLQWAIAFAYLIVVVLAALTLPMAGALYADAALISLVVIAALRPTKPSFSLLWRRSANMPVCSLRVLPAMAVLLVGLGLLLTSLLFLAAGGKLLGLPGDGGLPMTSLMAALVCWLSPGMFACLLPAITWLWRNNPARDLTPTFRVVGWPDRPIRQEVTRLARKHGFHVQFSREPVPECETEVRLVAPAQSEAAVFEPFWPLSVSLEDLREGNVFARLHRRDELRARRRILHGLERLFKEAASVRHPARGGYWVALHYWLWQGLLRDNSDEAMDETAVSVRYVGSSYPDVFRTETRQYAYRMMRALQVDAIYLEDGVSFRSLRRVIRVLFDTYDKSAGQRRAEDVHFLGLPKVRVIIHDIRFDDGFRSSTYPEPRFSEFGRMRLLHVFRDRGEHEEPLDSPFDFSEDPVPLSAD